MKSTMPPVRGLEKHMPGGRITGCGSKRKEPEPAINRNRNLSLPDKIAQYPTFCKKAKEKLVPPFWRNNCYSGWNGCVALHDPALGLQVTMQANGTLKDLMLYTRPKADYFCLEPQSHATGAVTNASR